MFKIPKSKNTSYNEMLNESILGDEFKEYFLTEKTEKVSLSKEVVSSIYNNIYNKYNASNFQEIEKTNGDITKLKDYKYLVDSIELLKGIFYKLDNKEFINNINIIDNTMKNILVNKKYFEGSFHNTYVILQLTYVSMVVGLIISISQMVTMTMLYMNDIEQNKIENTKQTSYFIAQMNRFNQLVNSGDISKLFKKLEHGDINRDLSEGFFSDFYKSSYQNDPNVVKGVADALKNTGARIGAIVSILLVPFLLLLLVRMIIYMYYRMRQDLSNYFVFVIDWVKHKKDSQDPISQAETIHKEEKLIANLKDMARKLDVNFDTNIKEVEREAKDEDRDIDRSISDKTTVLI